MRYTMLIAIALFTLASSCKNRHRVREAEKNMNADSTQNADSTTVSDAFADLENDMNFEFEEDTIFASISKGACFGQCPIYNIVVKQDGSVHYDGINFVDRKGVHTAQLTQEQMEELSEMAKQYGLDQMEDVYDSNITDLPTVTLSVTMDGTRKAIVKRHNYPEDLHKFQQFMDQFFEELEWTKVNSSKE